MNCETLSHSLKKWGHFSFSEFFTDNENPFFRLPNVFETFNVFSFCICSFLYLRH